MRIILASASPRRRELLEQIGMTFEVKASSVEEKVTAAEPGHVVEELSRQKAEAVLENIGDAAEAVPDTKYAAEAVLVIGADTVVVSEGRILGKPSGREEAAEMLRHLAGKQHEVYTGVTLLYRPPAAAREGAGTAEPGKDTGQAVSPRIKRKVFHEVTKVNFYPLTEDEISWYVSLGECMDKAGAYGIQGIFARFVRGIEGDYNNVVGLPAGRLYQEAKEWLEG